MADSAIRRRLPWNWMCAVHGGKLKYAERDPELVDSARNVCRDAILDRLEEDRQPKWDVIILGVQS